MKLFQKHLAVLSCLSVTLFGGLHADIDVSSLTELSASFHSDDCNRTKETLTFTFFDPVGPGAIGLGIVTYPYIVSPKGVLQVGTALVGGGGGTTTIVVTNADLGLWEVGYEINLPAAIHVFNVFGEAPTLVAETLHGTTTEVYAFINNLHSTKTQLSNTYSFFRRIPSP